MDGLNDDLNVQAGYRFRALDINGTAPAPAEFAGVPSSFSFRLPPSSLQIQRNIRAAVEKDLNAGFSIATGGEGLGRIIIQGTHGVGRGTSAAPVDFSKPSEGRAFRDQLTAFFSAFVAANEERGRRGKEGLRLIWEIVDGRWSNPEREAYLVWPEAFPSDIRGQARPHAWDWACSLILLRPWEAPRPVDPSKTQSPPAQVRAYDKLLARLDSAIAVWRGATAIGTKLRDLRTKLFQIRNRVQAFVDGAKDAIYTVTDLVRGSSQLCRDILRALAPADFLDSGAIALRGTLYDVRKTLGYSALVAQQFGRAGVVSGTLTSPQTASLSRPTTLKVAVGDSLQAIAARALGDSARWPELVSINGLDFPYVDFSGPDGAPGAEYAGLRVLGAADALKLPLPVSPGVVGVADDPVGTDIPDAPTEVGLLQGGIENLSAALIRRLITPRGWIPWHPLYGSNLPAMVGSAQSLGDIEDLRAEANQTLKAEPRVLGVQGVRVRIDGPVADFSADVLTPLGPLSISAPLPIS